MDNPELPPEALIIQKYLIFNLCVALLNVY